MNWVPRSECRITGLRSVHCQLAIITAFRTMWRSCTGDIDQPTTLPAYRSSTAHRYSQPSPVRM